MFRIIQMVRQLLIVSHPSEQQLLVVVDFRAQFVRDYRD